MKDKISFIFDTETNGFANCSVLSISFIICKNYKIITKDTRYYFSKEKYNYHATKVHGLTKEVIEEKRDNSYPLYFIDDKNWLIDIMEEYNIKNIVSHNTNFDIKFLPTEIIKRIDTNEYTTYCTMKNNSEFVGIKKGNGYKYPSLSESCRAYNIEFDSNEAHSSDYDTLKAYELFVATIKSIDKIQNKTIKQILSSENILNTLQTNKDKSLRILLQKPELVKYTNEEFLDKEFVRILSRENEYLTHIFNYFPPHILIKELLLHCLGNIFPETIQNLIVKYSKDKEYAIKLLYKQSSTLQYMSYEIQDDFELLFSIAKDKTKNEQNCRSLFEYASDRIRNSKEYLLKFLEFTYYSYPCIEYTNKKFHDDEDVVLCLLKNNWYDLINCPGCLEMRRFYISDKMLENDEIAYYCIGVVPFIRLPKKIKQNRDIILKAIKRESCFIEFIPLEILEQLNLIDELQEVLSKIDVDKKTTEETMRDMEVIG